MLTPLLFGIVLAQRPQPTRPFPESAATIDHVLLHFDPDSVEDWLPTARDLLRSLAAEVHVTIAVEGEEQARMCASLLQAQWSSRVETMTIGRSPTVWARDRMIAVGGDREGSVLLPDAETVVDGYEGDLEAACSFAARDHRICSASGLAFEGGDIVCGVQHAFIGWHTIARNMESGQSREQVVTAFAGLLGLEVVVLGSQGAPHEHVDMYLTVIDERTVALGDPDAGAAVLRRIEGTSTELALPDFDRWTIEAQERRVPFYDVIHCELVQQGLQVVRVPIVHGQHDGVLTWNNCLVERRGSERRAYMPIYGVRPLDDLAAEEYRKAGCHVLPIAAAAVAANGGTVRCITNVVGWSAPQMAPVVVPVPAAVGN